MAGGQRPLFQDRPLADVAAERAAKVVAEVRAWDPAALLKASVEELLSHLMEKYAFRPPLLDGEHIAREDPREVLIDGRAAGPELGFAGRPGQHARGTEYVFVIPFEGDGELFRYQPSSYGSTHHRGEVDGHELRVAISLVVHDPVAVRAAFDRNLEGLRVYTAACKRDCEKYNAAIQAAARQAVVERGNRLRKGEEVAAALGFPLKERPGAAETFRVPMKPRRLPLRMPAALLTAQPAVPSLADEDYENILRILSNMSIAFERSPTVFATLGEEALRTFFLVMLNGHYEGQATGETFNGLGKTDILIRAGNTNVFIAECKLWDGEQKFLDTIDQLLRYVTWRDTKTAILIFNRNKDFSNVLRAIPQSAQKHGAFKRADPAEGDTTFCFRLALPSDPERDVLLTVMAFDVPGGGVASRHKAGTTAQAPTPR